MLSKNNIRLISAILFTAACVLALAGCPYTTKNESIAHLSTLAVHSFKNETFYEGLTSDATTIVVQTFHLEGNLRTAPVDSADCLISGSIIDYRKEVVREESLDRGLEYRITIVARVTFTDKIKGANSFRDREFTGTWTYLTARGESETTGRREALRDLAQKIFSAISEKW